jgi:imidazoleglycerol phosphate dehydratase HisB
MTRRQELSRKTSEVEITGSLDLDGTGVSNIETGLGFLDHMLTALSKHSWIDLQISARGDTEVDDHHTVEDCAIAIAEGLDRALGDRAGIARFGSAYAPLDESLARSVIDLSGRGWPEVRLDLVRDQIGEVATENITHFFRSLAISGRMALHLDVIRGDNDHHKAEAAFKSTALALRSAISRTGSDRVPSTKGVL